MTREASAPFATALRIAFKAKRVSIPVAKEGPAGFPEWRCPREGLPLKASPDALECPRGHRYRIQDGIIRFVDAGNYSAAFGEQWKRFRKTQLDSHAGISLSRDRAMGAVGPNAFNALKGKRVLECGCGAGRFTEVLLAQGAQVTSVDLSEAVDANAMNFPQTAMHHVAQADILQLPFAPGSFDVVFCLGVIQHTPNPEATIAALYAQVRPGGLLVIDHYRDRLRWYTRTAPLYRAFLRRKPAGTALATVEGMVRRWLPLHRRARSRWARRFLARVSPVNSYYHAFPMLSDDLQREWALLDTHDALTDWYKHFRSPKQLRATLEQLGATNIETENRGSFAEARCRKPLTSTRPAAKAGG